METCQGCLKEFPSNSILRHVGKAKKCKDAYGSSYEDFKREKTLAVKRSYNSRNAASIKEKQNRHNHLEETKEKRRKYYQDNRKSIKR